MQEESQVLLVINMLKPPDLDADVVRQLRVVVDL